MGCERLAPVRLRLEDLHEGVFKMDGLDHEPAEVREHAEQSEDRDDPAAILLDAVDLQERRSGATSYRKCQSGPNTHRR